MLKVNEIKLPESNFFIAGDTKKLKYHYYYSIDELD
jgi:hypothetical protein